MSVFINSLANPPVHHLCHEKELRVNYSFVNLALNSTTKMDFFFLPHLTETFAVMGTFFKQ
jgi:hypothetical protein